MIRTICAIMVAAVAMCVAYGEDDDGVMGVWQGSITGGSLEGKVVRAKIWGVKKGAWDGTLVVLDGEKAIGEGTLSDPDTDKTFAFKGTAKIDREYALDASAANEKMTGTLKPAGGGIAVPFTLQRQHVVPPTLGAKAPDGAVVLMDGSNLDAWVMHPEKWSLVDEGAMEVNSPSLKTIQEFGSCKIHLEFRTPYMPGEGVGSQARGNSGVYVQGRYEVQVLDSFGVAPQNNLCGGIYKIAVPAADATLPPLTWQTYDIEFHAPKFDTSGTKTADAELTVIHNGIVIHDRLKLPNATPGGVTDQEGKTGPLLLQNHGDPVRYRNIWIQPIED